MSLLTYPLTLVPPAQMIEHYIASTCSIASSEAEPVAGAGRGKAQYGYGALELTPHDAETALPSSENSPLSGHGRGGAGSSSGSGSGGEGAPGQPAATSTHSRVLTRCAIVLSTTVIATFIPCFGMVSVP